ncbi:MAG: hypothetical protein ACFBSE_07380 [Prochloraceae cyanobacterium]
MITSHKRPELIATAIPDGMTKAGSIRYKVYLGVQSIGKIFRSPANLYYAVSSIETLKTGKTFYSKDRAIDWLVDCFYSRPIQKELTARDNSVSLLRSHDSSIKISEFASNNRYYPVNYRRQTIGTIRKGLDCWLARAGLKFGAFETKLETKRKAKGWLLNNYLKVVEAKIEFSVSENLCHYTIAGDSWLIKIYLREEDCIAVIREGDNSTREYFPTLNDAIAFSFDLILNSDSTIDNSQNEEF